MQVIDTVTPVATSFAPPYSATIPLEVDPEFEDRLSELTQCSALCEQRVVNRIAMHIAGAKYALRKNRLGEAKGLYKVALNLWVLSLLPESLLLSDITASLAEIEFLTEDYQRAEDLLNWSIKIDAKRLGTSHAQYLRKVDQFSGLQLARRHRMAATFKV